MNHMVAKQNDDDTWDIEVQALYNGRPVIVRIPCGAITIETLKAGKKAAWTIEAKDEMAVC